MLRVKMPQGVLSSDELGALADVADRWSRGFGHITTRQNMQFHFVKLHDAEPAMRRLAEAGLTTREACGNSVRNITCCPYAGVAADEPFDVTPYAEAMTRYLLRHPLSSTLPRKFKIAFEGCPTDHVNTAINDLGFRAVIGPRRRAGLPRDGRRRHRHHGREWRPAPRVPARVGDLPRGGSGPARVPPPRRLPAQAAQPDEVPDPHARMDAMARRVRPGTDGVPPAGPGAHLRRGAARRRIEAGLGEGGAATGGRVGVARRGGPRVRTRPDAADRAAAALGRRGVPAVARDQRQAAASVWLRDRDGHGDARRSDR